MFFLHLSIQLVSQLVQFFVGTLISGVPLDLIRKPKTPFHLMEYGSICRKSNTNQADEVFLKPQFFVILYCPLC